MKRVLTILIIIASSGWSHDFRLLTHSHMPPYTFVEDGKQVGILPDLVREIYKRSKISSAPHFLNIPWARAVNLAKKQRQTVIFPLTRTKRREPFFNWVGPAADATLAFATLDKNLSVITELRNKKVGCLRGAPTEARLKALGFTNIQAVEREEQNLKTLLRGGIDAWYSSKPILTYIISKKKVPTHEKKIHFLNDLKYQVYIATSKDLQALAKRWSRVLNEIRLDGTQQRIIDKYLRETE